MKIKKKVLSCLMVITLVSSALVGCSGKTTGDEGGGNGSKSSAEQVLNLRTNSVVVGLDPILNTTAPDNGAHNMVSEPLLRDRAVEGNKSEIVPAAASEWQASEDGKTYTFKFTDDRKWSDGKPMTAKDFEYTLKLMADPKVGATSAWLFDGIIEGFGEALYDGADPQSIGVSCPDDNILEIKLINPAAYFPELACSIRPVRQDKYEEWGKEYGSTLDKTLFSGPFVVESWDKNTGMKLAKNEHYWQADEMELEKINYDIIQEDATAVQAFISGDIDVNSTTDPNWAKQIKESGLANETTVPSGGPDYAMFNLDNEYLSNAKIRQALTITMNRDALKDLVWEGNAITTKSVIPDTMNIGDKSYTELVNGENYIVDQLKKDHPDPKALLIEGLKELGKPEDPSKVTLTYASRGTTEKSKKIAEIVKQSWEEALGINIEIDMMEWNIMWDKVDAGDFEIAAAGYGPYYNEPSALLGLFHPETGTYPKEKIGWDDENSKKFGELLDKARVTVDQQELANLYLEAEKILIGTGVIVPQYLLNSATYVNKRVEGYPISTNGSIDYSQVSIVEE